MKTNGLFGIVGATLVVSATASAATSDEARLQGYEAGWDTAQKFCVDLRPRERDELRASLYAFEEIEMPTREISVIYTRACKSGFDKHIDNNWACQQRIESERAYTRTRKARNNACE